MLLLALLAIIAPLFFLVVLRLSARLGMTISAVIVALTAYLAWGMTPLAINASIAQGVHRALTIGLILFGAIILLKTLEKTSALERIRLGLHTISRDMRIQTVIVAFAFVSLIEGISGFGTPSIVAAPLLLILGFRPLAAASLALMGDTIACTFGAVGTPLIVGLENVPIYSPELVAVVGAQVTTFDLVIGTILPLCLVAMLIFGFSSQTRANKWRSLREIAPWSLMIGLVYTISAFASVRLFGAEFASIIAAAISLVVSSLTVKNGWLTPKSTWRHHTEADITEKITSKKATKIPLWKAWLPYGFIILALFISRTVPAIKNLLAQIDLSWNNIFGLEGISSAWPILYSPGTILILGAIFASFFISKSAKPVLKSSQEAAKSTALALLALVPTLIMVQIFTNTGFNSKEFLSMPVFIGQALADSFGQFWLAASPILGTIGAFIAGSATVSNLTLAPVQYSIALDANLPFVTVLALQMIGAVAGNIIAIHNVVGASVVVGLVNQEGSVIRKLLTPTIGYILLAVLMGFITLTFTLQ